MHNYHINQDHRKYMTPDQIRKMQFTLFAMAAASMGKRIEQLQQQPGTEQLIETIRSEWVVEE